MKQNIPVPLTGGAGGDPVAKNMDERFLCECFLQQALSALKTITDRAAPLEGTPSLSCLAAQVLEEKAR